MSWSVSAGGKRDEAIGIALKQLEGIKAYGLPAAELKRAEQAVDAAVEFAIERAAEQDTVSISAWGSETFPDNESFYATTPSGQAQWNVTVARVAAVPDAAVTQGD